MCLAILDLLWEYGDGGNGREFGRVNWGLNPFYCSFSGWSVLGLRYDGFTWDLGFHPFSLLDNGLLVAEIFMQLFYLEMDLFISGCGLSRSEGRSARLFRFKLCSWNCP